MIKKVIFVTAVMASVFIFAIGGKKIVDELDVKSDDGKIFQMENSNDTDNADLVTDIEISAVGDNVVCTKTEVDNFLSSVSSEFGDKIERIWINGWQNEAGVQGSTMDDEIIYRILGMRARDAYITNTTEDILEMWESGEKIVLVGKNLVTDETTYRIGDEEYRIVGIFGEGPMDDHMHLPLQVYPELDTMNAVCIRFSKPLSDEEMDCLDNTVQETFAGKFSIK